ncbi:MAG: 4'-phosphopantetheinyl transferase superfamily protein [Bacillus subtilis]|nr:4'-phosphopantetheinyl transferase superfamily protein [Bacillus subtilis]
MISKSALNHRFRALKDIWRIDRREREAQIMIRGIGIGHRPNRPASTKPSPRRILTQHERRFFDTLSLDQARKRECLAGRFAVKEAIIKALSVATNIIGFRDVEVLARRIRKRLIATCPKAGSVRNRVALDRPRARLCQSAFCVVEAT